MSRFWEGEAALRSDAPQAQLRAVLEELKFTEPNWCSVISIMEAPDEDGKPAWKGWQKALTALAKRARAAAATARAEGWALAEDPPGGSTMRADGWEPLPELMARLALTWGEPESMEQGEERARIRWERVHAGGREAGNQVRCYVRPHALNPAWVRLEWASWREGMREEATMSEKLGAPPEVFSGDE